MRDYFLGTSLPIINSAKVIKVKTSSAENLEIQVSTINCHNVIVMLLIIILSKEIDIAIDFEYTGKFQLAIDADLVNLLLQLLYVM